VPDDLPAASSEPTGPALARAALEAALARRGAGARPARPPAEPPTGEGGEDSTGTGGKSPTERRSSRRAVRGYTAAGPDPRDPQPLGAVLARLIKVRGWQGPAAEATVFGQWERLVGADVAAHCRPIKLERGELTVEAESTAWATQLRLLAGRLLGRISAEVGTGVVARLHIHGPAAPSWDRGPRRVRGRGPRDTYG
jgi:predicted nucleic acid-binding Zn ribbon protein